MNNQNNHMFRFIRNGFAVFLVIFVVIQFARFIVPHFKLDNPPVIHTVNWDSVETEQMFYTSCADCHSNETVYPWYSYVAPVGWLVAHDIHEGREEFNISENHDIDLDDMVEVLEEGEMPLPMYTIIHRDAALDDTERQTLINGLRATFGNARDDD